MPGYAPAVEPVAGIPAETRPCQCGPSRASGSKSPYLQRGWYRIQRRNCSCDTEIARWIDLRERGRWVTDITPMHGYFEGETVRFRLENGTPISQT